MAGLSRAGSRTRNTSKPSTSYRPSNAPCSSWNCAGPGPLPEIRGQRRSGRSARIRGTQDPAVPFSGVLYLKGEKSRDQIAAPAPCRLGKISSSPCPRSRPDHPGLRPIAGTVRRLVAREGQTVAPATPGLPRRHGLRLAAEEYRLVPAPSASSTGSATAAARPALRPGVGGLSPGSTAQLRLQRAQLDLSRRDPRAMAGQVADLQIQPGSLVAPGPVNPPGPRPQSRSSSRWTRSPIAAAPAGRGLAWQRPAQPIQGHLDRPSPVGGLFPGGPSSRGPETGAGSEIMPGRGIAQVRLR